MVEQSVSVVIPMYNCEKYISATINSALSQKHTTEVICVDDCSRDNSVQVVRGLMENDSRLKVIVLDVNSGAAVARNKGIQLASSEYIAFLDADDIWSLNKLALQVQYLETRGYNICCSDYYLVRDEGNQSLVSVGLDTVSCGDLLKKNIVLCSSVLAKTSLLKKNEFPLIRRRQDFALWLKITVAGELIGVVGDPLVYYQLRSDSLSSSYIKSIYFNWRVFRDYGDLGIVRAFFSVIRQLIFAVKKRLS